MSATRTTLLLRSFLAHRPPNICRKLPSPRPLVSNQRFSQTCRANAAFASHSPTQPPSRTTTLVFSPSQQALEDEELDVELVPIPEARIDMTDRAAEKLREISARDSDPDVALRISVNSGGCHGYQYAMDLTSERRPDDYQFSHPKIKPSHVIVDAVSMPLLKGSTLDFATELIGSSFRITENPQAKGNGCGCGVSWELKE